MYFQSEDTIEGKLNYETCKSTLLSKGTKLKILGIQKDNPQLELQLDEKRYQHAFVRIIKNPYDSSLEGTTTYIWVNKNRYRNLKYTSLSNSLNDIYEKIIEERAIE